MKLLVAYQIGYFLGRLNAPKGRMETKPGYKSTEFWLSLAATLIGFVLASGVLNPADPQEARVLQALGFAAAILAQLGYTAARAYVKGGEVKALALVEASKRLPPS